ncbi:MAG TPA: ion transporter [Gemmatimonadales bacterium]|nr:ion transporter [Gemmatimonadales bacterium]
MPRSPLRDRVFDVIFTHDDPPARAFDVALIVAILASVVVVMLDSVAAISARYGAALRAAEWTFTVLFTLEYALRLWSERHPWRYARSFFGLVDLVAILPTYLTVVIPGARFFVALRVLRVLRIFRVLKLAHYVREGAVLGAALRASRYKITVFLTTVLTIVVVVGSMMYLVEGPASGFSSIPQSVYWAVVTLTTVGYGDIAPVTVVGKLLASLLMVLGYGIIAVPTGIVTLELDRAARAGAGLARRPCPGCGVERHAADARYCRYCGTPLPLGELE